MGRFLALPVSRTNLSKDLAGFFTEVLDDEDHDQIHNLVNSLIVNVLDAHLDNAYWQGRRTGHGEHHGTIPGVSTT
ncbi:hypothetical protein [Terracoccus sp. 273MFTsu3.1]|uniref:hypothetical protein n=1 Tax=Terracoccus sp. 273MFTsu3.1 TaxID=1172188 RepID=UPI0012DC7CE9|nr:hypothetical protein [Terracoccus sp. 273MFTsu3.1]